MSEPWLSSQVTKVQLHERHGDVCVVRVDYKNSIYWTDVVVRDSVMFVRTIYRDGARRNSRDTSRTFKDVAFAAKTFVEHQLAGG